MNFEQLKPDSFYGVENNVKIPIVVPTSKEWYIASPEQYYIPRTALTDFGKIEYEKICKRVENEKERGVFENAFFHPLSSGPWKASTSSPFFQKGDPLLILNSMNDYNIYGDLNGKQQRTTQIVWDGFKNNGEKWVLTKSGSVYYVRNNTFQKEVETTLRSLLNQTKSKQIEFDFMNHTSIAYYNTNHIHIVYKFEGFYVKNLFNVRTDPLVDIVRENIKQNYNSIIIETERSVDTRTPNNVMIVANDNSFDRENAFCVQLSFETTD